MMIVSDHKTQRNLLPVKIKMIWYRGEILERTADWDPPPSITRAIHVDSNTGRRLVKFVAFLTGGRPKLKVIIKPRTDTSFLL